VSRKAIFVLDELDSAVELVADVMSMGKDGLTRLVALEELCSSVLDRFSDGRRQYTTVQMLFLCYYLF
jgi:hypothetical protein